MRVYFHTIGCRLNEAETEQWAQTLLDRGYLPADRPEDADAVVFNTCAVTAGANRKSRNLLNHLNRRNPQAKLVATGCHATLEPDATRAISGVDMLVPNQDKDQLVDRLDELFEATPLRPHAEPAATTEHTLFSRGRQRAFIKVQDGCRYRCTYCIVTLARGEERSRPIDSIVNEINQLTQSGVQEAVLTGVHVGGYGADLGTDLSGLVRAILADTDLKRLRFASVEPWDLPSGFFDLFADDRLMPHMHLPLQSGSDSVLRRMARRCRTADFAALAEQARTRVPDFNITTDIIVGFPGETGDEWARTCDFVQDVGFGHIHIFPYSSRAGTKAATLPDQIDHETKSARVKELQCIAADLKHRTLQQAIGRTFEVLWEEPATDDQGNTVLSGYTPGFLRTRCQDHPNPSACENTLQRVQATGVDETGAVLEVRPVDEPRCPTTAAARVIPLKAI
jgi:threonylcarbamoyladenosine tRNA methylthiotransferase MtaB